MGIKVAANRRDITGEKFSRLVALYKTGVNERGKDIWKFECDCGRTTITTSDLVVYGQTKSCGCLQREARRRNAAYAMHRGRKISEGIAALGDIHATLKQR